MIKYSWKSSSSLKEFINSQGVPSDAKKDFFDKLLKNKVHTYVLHFLCLLIDKKRERNIEAVCEEFNTLCNEYFNVLEGVVYSTKALTKDQITNIENSIQIKLNKKVDCVGKRACFVSVLWCGEKRIKVGKNKEKTAFSQLNLCVFWFFFAKMARI